MTKAVEPACPSCGSRKPRRAARPRIDRGEEVIVGVNQVPARRGTEIDVLDIDNSQVRDAQLARLEKVRATRDGRLSRRRWRL